MFDVYTGILKMMDDFYDDGMDITIRYLLDADYTELLSTYKLNEIAGNSGI